MMRAKWRCQLLAIVLVTACSSSTQSSRGLSEPVRVAFESPLHLIVLEARVRGEGPFRFILDSGASSTVLDLDLARRLGLETASSTTQRGTAAGSQVTIAPIRGGVGFVLAPGFEVHVNNVIAAPVTQTVVMVGEHFDGILGSAIFYQYVIEVDYEKRSVVFHDPGTYSYDREGSVLDLEFPAQVSRIPFIRATLVNGDRRLDDFLISIDSGGQTMGTASVAKRSEWDGLITPEDRVVGVLGATGLSNEAEGITHEAFTAQMDRFIMGPFEFEGPVVSYSAGGPGFASMGASLLHRFTAVFDYSRKRLILEPNVDLHAPPMIDRSGAMLVMSDAGDRAFRVMFVADGTPAHDAGLLRGDNIRAVDRVPTREIPLNKARAMFCRDSRYMLEVERDGRMLATVLETRSLYEK